jgi:hypothetical protein
MISNELAKTINWVGKGGKIAFSTLKLNNVLKGIYVYIFLKK